MRTANLRAEPARRRSELTLILGFLLIWSPGLRWLPLCPNIEALPAHLIIPVVTPIAWVLGLGWILVCGILGGDVRDDWQVQSLVILATLYSYLFPLILWRYRLYVAYWAWIFVCFLVALALCHRPPMPICGTQ